MTADLQSLSDDELLARHAKAMADYSVARAEPGGSEYMPWIQAELSQINREMERRGKWGDGTGPER